MNTSCVNATCVATTSPLPKNWSLFGCIQLVCQVAYTTAVEWTTSQAGVSDVNSYLSSLDCQCIPLYMKADLALATTNFTLRMWVGKNNATVQASAPFAFSPVMYTFMQTSAFMVTYVPAVNAPYEVPVPNLPFFGSMFITFPMSDPTGYGIVPRPVQQVAYGNSNIYYGSATVQNALSFGVFINNSYIAPGDSFSCSDMAALTATGVFTWPFLFNVGNQLMSLGPATTIATTSPLMVGAGAAAIPSGVFEIYVVSSAEVSKKFVLGLRLQLTTAAQGAPPCTITVNLNSTLVGTVTYSIPANGTDSIPVSGVVAPSEFYTLVGQAVCLSTEDTLQVNFTDNDGPVSLQLNLAGASTSTVYAYSSVYTLAATPTNSAGVLEFAVVLSASDVRGNNAAVPPGGLQTLQLTNNTSYTVTATLPAGSVPGTLTLNPADAINVYAPAVGIVGISAASQPTPLLLQVPYTVSNSTPQSVGGAPLYATATGPGIALFETDMTITVVADPTFTGKAIVWPRSGLSGVNLTAVPFSMLVYDAGSTYYSSWTLSPWLAASVVFQVQSLDTATIYGTSYSSVTFAVPVSAILAATTSTVFGTDCTVGTTCADVSRSPPGCVSVTSVTPTNITLSIKIATFAQSALCYAEDVCFQNGFTDSRTIVNSVPLMSYGYFSKNFGSLCADIAKDPASEAFVQCKVTAACVAPAGNNMPECACVNFNASNVPVAELSNQTYTQFTDAVVAAANLTQFPTIMTQNLTCWWPPCATGQDANGFLPPPADSNCSNQSIVNCFSKISGITGNSVVNQQVVQQNCSTAPVPPGPGPGPGPPAPPLPPASWNAYVYLPPFTPATTSYTPVGQVLVAPNVPRWEMPTVAGVAVLLLAIILLATLLPK